MSLADIIKADLQLINADLGEPTITWNDEDYECIPSSNGSTSNLEEGGFSVDADLIINIRKELFTDEVFPQAQQKLTYNDVVYRIQTVRTDATNTFLRLVCTDINKGV